MMKIVIITPSLFDFTRNALKIGGLETYIKDLALLGVELCLETIVYQFDFVTSEKTEYNYQGVRIINLPLSRPSMFDHVNQKAFDMIFDAHNSINTKFIIATDQMNIKSKAQNVIAIQHGIAFDIPGYDINGFWRKSRTLQFVNKLLRCVKNVRRFYSTRNTVCVDYNYFNWLRTLGTIYEDYTLNVIPNYASSFITEGELDEKLGKRSSLVKIVFARRFVDYRGALLFAGVVCKLLKERDDLDITFAGNGPLEHALKEQFKNMKHVHFTSFSADQSVHFHKSFDIAVVPTIFSEGTSLSLCEAMAAGCIPIATHVGGMTNIILDGYNGVLAFPSLEAVHEAVLKVIDFKDEERTHMILNSYNTVKYAFSIDMWKSKWQKLILP